MRDEGLIDGWGMGVNSPEPILRRLEVADSDVHLVASQYSLIDHANAVENVLPAAREKGVSFVVGSALNAGFLGGEPHYNYDEENTLIPDAKRGALATLRTVASRHGVDLVAAALQFSLAPDVASALIVNAARPEHILADHAALRPKIRPPFGRSFGPTGSSIPTRPCRIRLEPWRCSSRPTRTSAIIER